MALISCSLSKFAFAVIHQRQKWPAKWDQAQQTHEGPFEAGSTELKNTPAEGDAPAVPESATSGQHRARGGLTAWEAARNSPVWSEGAHSYQTGDAAGPAGQTAKASLVPGKPFSTSHFNTPGGESEKVLLGPAVGRDLSSAQRW